MVATRVLPSPVFISAMSPSCSTTAPMIWTSKGRIPTERFAASRTAAKASNESSSSDSPFSRRCRNSTVLPASSSSERASKSGSSEVT